MAVLGYYWLFGISGSTVSAHLPESRRSATALAAGRGRRRKGDRGLPEDSDLRELAKTYLTEQWRHWPELARSGQLPEPTDEVLAEYAEAFRQTFLGPAHAPHFSGDRCWNPGHFAVCYLRFSSDNSNPRSLDQQLRNVLEPAQRHGHQIPWRLVFADSGVTGATAGRTGYQLTKAAMAESPGPFALYFDDGSRLSRDMAETIHFCRDLQERGQRVLGASDGFDSESEMYKAMLGVSGLVHEFYIDGLKKKVTRGQDDSFRLGKNMGPPAFGYQLQPITGPDGQPLLNRKRQQTRQVAIDEQNAEIVREVFRRYLDRGWSLQKNARWLNEIQAGRRQSWGPTDVAKILDRWAYVGIELRNTVRQRKDRETGKITEEKRPRSDWQCRRMRHLQIIDRVTWKAVRKRRAARASLFPEGSRGRVATYPDRLLTLICGKCGAALVLGKGGKYCQVRCPNAAEGKRGCTYGGYKSLKKIEQPILKLVTERLSDPALIDRIVDEVHAIEEELAQRPAPDLVPLQERVRDLKAEGTRLVEAIASSDAAVSVLAPRLEENQRRLAEARERLAEAKAATQGPLEPITPEEVRSMIADLQSLLADEAAIAAPVLRELLGEITISQQIEPGCAKPVWYAEFRFDLFRAVAKASSRANSSNTNAGLSRIAGQVAGMEPERMRIDPLPKVPKPVKIPPYIQIANDVVRLRDEALTFTEIGRRLGVHEVTAMRAYDHSRPDERPSKGQKRVQGGRSMLLRRRITELLERGASLEEAARQANCSTMTVYRVRRSFQDQPEGSEAA